MVAGEKPGTTTKIPLYGTFASSAFAACWAETCTIPLDTAKVRLQLQGKALAGAENVVPKYRGMIGTVRTIAREEGVLSLWRGIVPGLHRQCLFGGLRIGLYEPVKTMYVGKDHVGDVPFYKKVAAGLTTEGSAWEEKPGSREFHDEEGDLGGKIVLGGQNGGWDGGYEACIEAELKNTTDSLDIVLFSIVGALAIAVANPTDLVKVRLQAEGKLPSGVPRRYSGALNAYSTIAKQEGVTALWKGLGPNVARNAIVNAAELASYDQVKQTLLKLPGFEDNIVTHILSGLGAGFFAVCVGSPVDVVKSRVMGDSTKQYSGTLNCFVKTFRNDGIFAFYKGFLPNFGRLGSWNVIMFLTFEQAKKLFTQEIPAPAPA